MVFDNHLSMENKNLVAVVIPYYHSDLSESERISLNQCLNVLYKFDIILIVPSNMPKEEFSNIGNVSTVSVPAEWLDSIDSYNQMMLERRFYEIFIDYKYILIYQLDVFVFNDRLTYFCELGLDYIGAPWLYGVYYFVDNANMVWYVGNGGFSLRNVKSCINVIDNNRDKLQNSKIIEDVFFSTQKSNNFRVAPVDIALKFSIENQVEESFMQNNCKLPFGCHAWHKNNIKFWKEYIERFGFRLSKELMENGSNDEKNEDLYKINIKFNSFCLRNMEKCNDKIRSVLERLFGEEIEDVILFGYCSRGIWLKDWLERFNVKVRYFCDNNQSKMGIKEEIYNIMSPKYLFQDIKKKHIIISVRNSKYEEEISNQLNLMGCEYRKSYISSNDLLKAL